MPDASVVLLKTPVTRYRSHAEAQAIATVNSNNDPTWKYEVRASGDCWVVVCRDEDGCGLGAL